MTAVTGAEEYIDAGFALHSIPSCQKQKNTCTGNNYSVRGCQTAAHERIQNIGPRAHSEYRTPSSDL